MVGVSFQETNLIPKIEDIEESFVRSSGPGGQNINKVSTCVVLKHHPTGIVVKCQQYRTQHQNRVRAYELLVSEIERRTILLAQVRRSALEKSRRQTRGRSRAGKVELKAQKKLQSLRKAHRSRVKSED